MPLRNRDGTPVDAVPFLVVASMSVLICYSFGPVYAITIGLEGPAVFGLPTVVCVATVAAAYHRLVYTAHPELRGELPPGQRLKGLLYAALAGAAVLVALSLPLLLP